MVQPIDLGTILNPGFDEIFTVESLDLINNSIVIKSGQILLVKATSNLYVGDGKTILSAISPIGAGGSGGVVGTGGGTLTSAAAIASDVALGPPVLVPSGDTTGVTDAVNINAALLVRDIRLVGAYYLNAPIKMPSNRLLVLDGATVTLAAGANCNIITNLDYTAGNTNITVIGNGIFNGNASNQVRQSQAWKNVGVNWVNVNGLKCEGYTIKNTNLFASLSVGVVNARYTSIRIEQDLSVANQDGLDIGPACSNIIIDGVSGNTQDDVFSIFAKYTTSADVVNSLYKPGGANYSAAGNNTFDITVRNVVISAGINMFRIQAADGSKIYNIRAENIRHIGTTPCRALVSFGTLQAIYYTTLPDSSGLDLRDIFITGFTGAVESLVFVDSYVKNVHIKDVQLNTSWGNILATKDSTAVPGDIFDMLIENVTSSLGMSTSVGNLIAAPSNRVFNNVTLRNFKLAACKYLATGGGAINNVSYENLELSTLVSTSSVFNATGTFTGRYFNVTTGTTGLSMGTPPATPAIDKFDQILTRPANANVSTNSAITINANVTDYWQYNLTANVTSSTITNPVAGKVLSIVFIQDATGGRTYTWPTSCKFAGNTAPSDTTASTRTTVTFRYDGSFWREQSRAVAVP